MSPYPQGASRITLYFALKYLYLALKLGALFPHRSQMKACSDFQAGVRAGRCRPCPSTQTGRAPPGRKGSYSGWRPRAGGQRHSATRKENAEITGDVID